jgi:cellulose biosynthesis protein BcsE
MSAVAWSLSAASPTRSRRSRLAQLGLRVRHALFPETCRMRLPFAGLAPGLGEVYAGGPALLLCADNDARESLLGALTAALDAGEHEQGVTWLCAAARAPLFMDASLRGVIDEGLLRLMTWNEDAAAQVRELGPVHLLRELLSGGMQSDDLLIVDLFDPWMAERPAHAALEAGIAEGLACLEHWGREHRGPILALAPTHRRGRALLPLVAGSRIPRLAALQAQGAQAHLDIVRWGAAHRPGPNGQRIELESAGAGRWRQRAAQPFEIGGLLTAADANVVHAMGGALHDAAGLPAGWQSHASLEALLASADEMVAATVVFAYEHPDSLPILAGAISRLRREHPHLLRIVVRETRAAMRQNGELALLRMGANAVVRRSQGFAHLESTVDELRGEVYTRKPVSNPARLLQRLAPESVQGYLPAGAFCSAVERMLERTADVPLEHCLVRLPLLAHMSRADALQACVPRRDGDLVTADERHLYLFLFGCPADDAMAALDSIFAIPCSEIACNVQIDPEHYLQRRTLAELRRRLPPTPGEGAEASSCASAVGGPPQSAVLPTRSPEPARQVQAHVLPLRAAV